MTTKRHPCVISPSDVPEKERGPYPHSDERLGFSRPIGAAAGLLKIGLHVQRLLPGQRSSWPHAEEDEEEFVYVLEGTVDLWLDGEVHSMKAGDLAAFPSGTGISHCVLNNSDAEAVLLVGGEREKKHSRIKYPLHPSRRADLTWSQWWDDAPERKLGPHDGMPDKLRARAASKAQGG
jgi:uncharacterized cupin superfamily protein